MKILLIFLFCSVVFMPAWSCGPDLNRYQIADALVIDTVLAQEMLNHYTIVKNIKVDSTLDTIPAPEGVYYK